VRSIPSRSRAAAVCGVVGGLLALAAVAILELPGAHSAASQSAASPSRSPSCVPPTLNVSAALAGERVTVSPAPQTRDASANTQISFLGVPAGELADVTVSGSRSGPHSGRLEAYSQGDGASFVPAHAFDDGELVTVHAELREGTKAVPFTWSFTVAVRDDPGTASATNTASGANPVPTPPPKEYQSFQSAPGLRPPDITTSTTAHTATGELFLAPYSGVGQYGPMILNDQGELVWFKSLSPSGTRAANLRVQEYEGKPVLTWWQDPLVANGSHTAGDVIANSSYQEIADVRAGNGYQPDLHEFQITPQGTALITVYDAIDCNLSSVGGPSDGALADTLLQEVDLKTGLVMYEWHSVDHVPLSDSYASVKPASRSEPYDFFHINSIDVEQDGDLLVDSRNTWAAYDVDPKTGQVRWELGGKRSSFKMGAGTITAWQHDAIQQPDGAITFFDNGASPQVHPQSRAIEVSLNTRSMTATLTRRYEHENPLVADSQGNVQALADGDWMVGWGQAGYLSEIGPAGQLLFNAHLPSGWESYRTFVGDWSGEPKQPPAIAAKRASGANGAVIVYASWNGATEVASWRALTGASSTSLAPVTSAPKAGFETAISLPRSVSGRYLAVQALDSAGTVIGSSAAVAMPGPSS
jgi:Arylsulfotransferase (ASST)